VASAIHQSQPNRGIRRASEHMFVPLELRTETLRSSESNFANLVGGLGGPQSTRRSELNDQDYAAGPEP
jgi:hypothetical protein